MKHGYFSDRMLQITAISYLSSVVTGCEN